VTAYPDTSFLCALYVPQDNSAVAAAHYREMSEPIHVTALLLYEFRQSARFQTFLHAQDRRKGYPVTVAEKAIADLQSDLATSVVVIVSADWPDVYAIAERLSAQSTGRGGHRAFDLLHVATALTLGARQFLTFDANQRRVAETEGLKVKP